MPRYPRYEASGATHHVVSQGNGRQPFVLDDGDREAFLGRFRRIAREHDWVVHAESLLDTHHHAVVTTPEPTLGCGMRLVLGGHAAWFNTRHSREGAVFADRFWSRRAEAHLVRACVYVLVNPVAAGIVSHPRDWPWSNWEDLELEGCSPAVEAIAGSTAGFLRLVEDSVVRLRATRCSSGREVWAIIGTLDSARGRG